MWCHTEEKTQNRMAAETKSMKQIPEKCDRWELLESDSRTRRSESWHLHFLANAFSYEAAKKHSNLQNTEKLKYCLQSKTMTPGCELNIDVCHDNHVHVTVACSTKTTLMPVCCSMQVKMVKGRAIMSLCHFSARRAANETCQFSSASEICHLVIRILLWC